MPDPNAVDVGEVLKLVPAAGGTGVMAWIVYMLGSGKWVPRAELEHERNRADTLQKFVTEEMTPALVRATDAVNNAQIETQVRRRQ